MALIDYLVLCLYFAGTLALGFFFAGRNRSVADMFAAGGRSPWWVAGLSSFMTMFSAGTFVVWGGIAYRHGLVAVSINMCYGIAALLAGYFVAGRWKRLGVRTPAQFIELRFGTGAVQFYTWSMMSFRMITIGVALYSLAIILVALMPLPEGHLLRDPATGNISLAFVIVAFGAIILTYTMAGGLWAVLMTDVVQFIILNLTVVFILVLTFARIQAGEVALADPPPGFLRPIAAGYSWLFLAGWSAIHFFIIGAEWAFAQRFLSVSSEKEARRSTYLFGWLYLVSPFIWLAPPLLYRLVDPTVDPEQAYILAGQAVLPAGMIGLLVAAMFSATASLVSSHLNVFAGVLTDEIYRRFIRPDASEPSLVLVGRCISAALGVLLIGIALSIPYLGGAEAVIVTLTSLVVGPLLAPTVWGLMSPRINARAVWVTAGTCFAAGLVLKFAFAIDGSLASMNEFEPVSRWVQGNPEATDILIGVVLPVAVLLLLQWRSTGESTGWRRVHEMMPAGGAVAAASTPTDRTPARIVGIVLAGCAVLMTILAAASDVQRGALLAFGIVLGLLAAVILVTIRRPAPGARRSAAEGR